jgi:hypothetical protein
LQSALIREETPISGLDLVSPQNSDKNCRRDSRASRVQVMPESYTSIDNAVDSLGNHKSEYGIVVRRWMEPVVRGDG